MKTIDNQHANGELVMVEKIDAATLATREEDDADEFAALEKASTSKKPSKYIRYKTWTFEALKQSAPDLATRVESLPSAILHGERQDRFTAFVTELGEEDDCTIKVLRCVIQQLGWTTSLLLLVETRAIEAAGGLWSVTTKQRRTTGGVFFAITKTKHKRKWAKIHWFQLQHLRPGAVSPPVAKVEVVSPPKLAAIRSPAPEAAPPPKPVMPRTLPAPAPRAQPVVEVIRRRPCPQ
jgi:hypothetical protein